MKHAHYLLCSAPLIFHLFHKLLHLLTCARRSADTVSVCTY